MKSWGSCLPYHTKITKHNSAHENSFYNQFDFYPTNVSYRNKPTQIKTKMLGTYKCRWNWKWHLAVDSTTKFITQILFINNRIAFLPVLFLLMLWGSWEVLRDIISKTCRQLALTKTLGSRHMMDPTLTPLWGSR